VLGLVDARVDGGRSAGGLGMSPFAWLVCFAWVPVSLLAFAMLRPHIAVLVVMMSGFLFLPNLELLRDRPFPWEKREAIGLVLTLGVLAFDSRRVLRFRPRWMDAFVGLWLVVPSISSLANGHGPYDAGSALMHRWLLWGAAYFVGALYLRTHKDLRDVLWAVFLGGLAYVPLCLIEVRLSPQLHYWLYGMHQHPFFSQTKRGGGFRPMVFLDHGLQASLWMATAMVAGAGLWWLLRVRQARGFSMGWLVAAVAVAWVLSKSTGAMVIGGLGLMMLALSSMHWLRIGVMIAVVTYLAARLFGDGVIEQWLVDAAGMVSADRAQSLQFRYDNEAVLLERCWQRPLFGSSPWGFNTFEGYDSSSSVKYAVPDSLWIYAFTINGLVGLIGVIGSLLVPAVRTFTLAALWRNRISPESLICALIVMMYLVDSLVNGFKTPIYIFMAGGLSRVLVRPSATDTETPSSTKHVASRSPLQPRSADSGLHRDRVLEPRGRPTNLGE
jgi:hypothetical protein